MVLIYRYAQHPIGRLRAPRGDPWFNYSGFGHHPLVAQQPVLSPADALAIDVEYAKRMRSLLSVDDLVVGLHDLLIRHDPHPHPHLTLPSPYP